MSTSVPPDPHVWTCSECQAALDMDPLDEHALTQVQIERVNRGFEQHCRHGRRGSSPVIPEERD